MTDTSVDIEIPWNLANCDILHQDLIFWMDGSLINTPFQISTQLSGRAHGGLSPANDPVTAENSNKIQDPCMGLLTHIQGSIVNSSVGELISPCLLDRQSNEEPEQQKPLLHQSPNHIENKQLAV